MPSCRWASELRQLRALPGDARRLAQHAGLGALHARLDAERKHADQQRQAGDRQQRHGQRMRQVEVPRAALALREKNQIHGAGPSAVAGYSRVALGDRLTRLSWRSRGFPVAFASPPYVRRPGSLSVARDYAEEAPSRQEDNCQKARRFRLQTDCVLHGLRAPRTLSGIMKDQGWMHGLQQVRGQQQEWLEWFRESAAGGAARLDRQRGAQGRGAHGARRPRPPGAPGCAMRSMRSEPQAQGARAGYCKNEGARDARGPLGPERIARKR